MTIDEAVAGRADALTEAFQASASSDRLQTALTAGTYPRSEYAEPLIAQCAVETDFYVRDMLTWALTQLPRDATLPLLLVELSSPVPQARSQALHTLSKLAEASTWPAIRSTHLHDADDEVARAAWRTAAGLVPDDEAENLASELVRELGRGDLDVHRSLSRALVEIGEAAAPKLEWISADPAAPEAVRRHARASLRLIEDPDSTFVLE